jgi:hypothetical protein
MHIDMDRTQDLRGWISPSIGQLTDVDKDEGGTLTQHPATNGRRTIHIHLVISIYLPAFYYSKYRRLSGQRKRLHP